MVLDFLSIANSKPLTSEPAGNDSIKKQPLSKRNSVHKEPVDAVIISNSLAAATSKETNQDSISIENAIAKTSKGSSIYIYCLSKFFHFVNFELEIHTSCTACGNHFSILSSIFQ